MGLQFSDLINQVVVLYVNATFGDFVVGWFMQVTLLDGFHCYIDITCTATVR